MGSRIAASEDTKMNTTETLLDVLKAVARKLDSPSNQDDQDLLDGVYSVITDIEVNGMELRNGQ